MSVLVAVCVCVHQPLCDGSHKAINQQATDNNQAVQYRSHKFEVSEQRQYALCNCKQTARRPFCDGTHKLQWVHDAAANVK